MAGESGHEVKLDRTGLGMIKLSWGFTLKEKTETVELSELSVLKPGSLLMKMNRLCSVPGTKSSPPTSSEMGSHKELYAPLTM